MRVAEYKSKWTYPQMRDVCNFIGGSQPAKSEFVFERREGYIRLIQIRDYKSDKNTTYIPLDKARRFCTKDDIMIGRYGPPLFQILRELEGAYNVALMKAEPKNTAILNKEYLYYFLRNQKLFDYVVFNSERTAGQDGVKKELLETYKIPLPPLEEQKRIAAILDKADAIRRKRREAIALTEELLRSTFLDMFGDPVTNPKGWDLGKLSDMCKKISDGTHHSPPVVSEGIPYITAKHLKKYGLDFHSNPWFIAETEHKKIYARCNPEKGDVLYIKDGATTGIAAINNYNFEFSMLSSLALLKVGESLTSEYLCDWLNSENVKRENLTKIAGAAITRLTLTKIKNFQIPVPPLNIQNKYKEFRQKISKFKSNIYADNNISDDLFNSLLQKAFRGEL